MSDVLKNDKLQIDPDADDAPSEEQLDHFLERVVPHHTRAAKARGLEGRAFVKVGELADPDDPLTIDGPPKMEGARLVPSAWPLSGRVRLSDGGTWTVQNNVIQPIWLAGHWFANIVTLVRVDESVPNSRLPIIPEGFDEVEPMGLVHRRIRDHARSLTIQRLVRLAADWGDWSPLPQKELDHDLRASRARPTVIEHLQQLRQNGYLKFEERGGQVYIHFLPTFVNLFAPEKSTPS